MVTLSSPYQQLTKTYQRSTAYGSEFPTVEIESANLSVEMDQNPCLQVVEALFELVLLFVQ